MLRRRNAITEIMRSTSPTQIRNLRDATIPPVIRSAMDMKMMMANINDIGTFPNGVESSCLEVPRYS
jgi:hypothetical protein